jgi:hypothetical protein
MKSMTSFMGRTSSWRSLVVVMRRDGPAGFSLRELSERHQQ